MSTMRIRMLHFEHTEEQAWLSVSLGDIKRLGIAHRISQHSRMSVRRVYLDGNTDGLMFYQVASIANIQIECKCRHVDATNSIRQHALYNPYWVFNPIAIGSVVTLAKEMVRIVAKDPTHYFIAIHGYCEPRYRIPASNPYRYVCPPDYCFPYPQDQGNC